jgi:hypothetical protein
VSARLGDADGLPSPQSPGEGKSRFGGLSNAAKLNVAGLVATAGGMLLQIAAGSTLYPSLAGPIVLLVAAVLVVFGPARWAPWVGLLVPLLLGVGATIAAVMTGEFIGQLSDFGNAGIVLGSLMHVIGLVAAVAGGLGLLLGWRAAGGRER